MLRCSECGVIVYLAEDPDNVVIQEWYEIVDMLTENEKIYCRECYTSQFNKNSDK